MKYDLIAAMLAGSHLYGTNRPDSDVDIRGVCFSTEHSLLGLYSFEQWMPKKNEAQTYSKNKFNLVSDDITIYSLAKFFKLCLGSNPNIIELLFCKEPLFTTKVWVEIVKNKNLFLSTKCLHTFVGYAQSQLKRIENHKKWLDKPPEKPEPSDYGKVTDKDGTHIWLSPTNKNVYSGKLKKYQSYTQWIKSRNPRRAELESKFGYDTKHAAHLFRLFYEADELLRTGRITHPLKDETRHKVMDVLTGKISYEEVVLKGTTMKDKLLNCNTNLPKYPDEKGAEVLLIKLQKENLLKQK